MIAPAAFLDRLTALADSTRSRILLLLDRNELTVGELATVLQLPQSTVSRHLRVLSDEAWVVARGEGTSRYYSMPAAALDASSRQLWQVVREQITAAPGAAQDARRAERVLARRRNRMREFLSSAAGAWDKHRAALIGDRTDLLALMHLLDPAWVVGDLGCGTGHVAEALAPCVGRVIAVDESGPMLTAARARLRGTGNVEFREGTLEALPLEDATLDAAVLFLVAHYLADPAQALREIRRVLKPNGRALIVDLMPHDRAEYVAQYGHVWQGFDPARMSAWMRRAGFADCRAHALPAAEEAKGPALFVAAGTA